jgi:hypothetical protein
MQARVSPLRKTSARAPMSCVNCAYLAWNNPAADELGEVSLGQRHEIEAPSEGGRSLTRLACAKGLKPNPDIQDNLRRSGCSGWGAYSGRPPRFVMQQDHARTSFKRSILLIALSVVGLAVALFMFLK